MANRRGKAGSNDRFPLLGLQKITADGDCSHEIRRWLLLGRKAMTNLDGVLKSRHYSANKDPYSQDYDLPSGHAQLWEQDRKEGRSSKNYCLQTVVLKKTLNCPLDSKEIKPVNLKGHHPWILIERTFAEAPIFWSPDMNSWLIGKVPDAGKDWGQKKRESEDKMAGWHHRCNGHELGQTSGDGEGQGGLACCSPWRCKESDTTGQLNTPTTA